MASDVSVHIDHELHVFFVQYRSHWSISINKLLASVLCCAGAVVFKTSMWNEHVVKASNLNALLLLNKQNCVLFCRWDWVTPEFCGTPLCTDVHLVNPIDFSSVVFISLFLINCCSSIVGPRKRQPNSTLYATTSSVICIIISLNLLKAYKISMQCYNGASIKYLLT